MTAQETLIAREVLGAECAMGDATTCCTAALVHVL